jgi:hypothetical protein
VEKVALCKGLLSRKGKENEMKLWVTPNGDRWLCDECQPEFEEQIIDEKWRAAFEELDQMLRCSHCKHSDVEIPD